MKMEEEDEDEACHRKAMVQKRQEWVNVQECWWFFPEKLLWLHLKPLLPYKVIFKNHQEHGKLSSKTIFNPVN